MKIIVCILALGFICVFAKSDTTTVVNCKCDTLKIVKEVILKIDTVKTIKLDTLKAKK